VPVTHDEIEDIVRGLTPVLKEYVAQALAPLRQKLVETDAGIVILQAEIDALRGQLDTARTFTGIARGLSDEEGAWK